MTILELRDKTGMNRANFAKYFGIPYRTIQDWESDISKNKPTDYLLLLMEYKLAKENMFIR